MSCDILRIENMSLKLRLHHSFYILFNADIFLFSINKNIHMANCFYCGFAMHTQDIPSTFRKIIRRLVLPSSKKPILIYIEKVCTKLLKPGVCAYVFKVSD